ncbi:MAG: hypothetical protein Q7S31_04220 [bacterium]|nr:hypothetical protein [bacterium]
MDKVLIVCGPTATGKTNLGIELAREFNGEIVSADSRQVYIGKNISYGKDLPPSLLPRLSTLKWQGRLLKYYEVEGIPIWLYDVVKEKVQFSVSSWLECAQLVIKDILTRQKLPIVVGGSGLYLKSLLKSLPQISIPPSPQLRQDLADKDTDYLFEYLNQIDPVKAASMNESDRQNPRRLVRAIEITVQDSQVPLTWTTANYDWLQIGLTSAKDQLYKRIDERVDERIAAGANQENPDLAAHPQKWREMEHQIARGQLTWFRKQPGITWFDIFQPDWPSQAKQVIRSWYNKH